MLQIPCAIDVVLCFYGIQKTLNHRVGICVVGGFAHIYLTARLARFGLEVNIVALDVNGDGSVNNKDVTRLMQYNAGWDVEIH